MLFLGIDLGWYGRPSGVAALAFGNDARLHITALDRITGVPAILAWIDRTACILPAMIAIDAPTIIPNASGSRAAEKQVNAVYRRYHAGCHAANQSRPFAPLTAGFAKELVSRGYLHAAEMTPQRPGRYQIEVHPHAATVELFGLDRIVKYKRGPLASRRAGLGRLRSLMREHYSRLVPSLEVDALPPIPLTGGTSLKDAEDRLDAVTAAYVGAHWWYWGTERNRVFGSVTDGFIVIPKLGVTESATA